MELTRNFVTKMALRVWNLVMPEGVRPLMIVPQNSLTRLCAGDELQSAVRRERWNAST